MLVCLTLLGCRQRRQGRPQGVLVVNGGKLWTGYGGVQGLSTPTTVKATVNGATEGRGEDHGQGRTEDQGARIQCKDCFLAAECRMQHEAADQSQLQAARWMRCKMRKGASNPSTTSEEVWG